MKLEDFMEARKLRELRELGDGNDDFLLDLLDRYLKKSREQLSEAREALAAGKLEELRDIIHSWKGATTALGLTALYNELTDFNNRLKEGEHSESERYLENLEHSLDQVRVSRGDESHP